MKTEDKFLATGALFAASYFMVLEGRVSANVFTAALIGMALGAILGQDPAVAAVVGLTAAVGTETLFPNESCCAPGKK